MLFPTKYTGWCSTHAEETVTGHSRLTGDTSGDDDDLASLEGLLEGTGEVTLGGLGVSDDGGGGVDVANISGNTGGTTEVVEGEGGDERVGLEEEGEGLSNTTCEIGKER